MKELENKIREALPRLKNMSDFTAIGYSIMLNDVLEWHGKDGRDRYSHFGVIEEKAYFVIYDEEYPDMLIWDLSSVFLADQSSEFLEIYKEWL